MSIVQHIPTFRKIIAPISLAGSYLIKNWHHRRNVAGNTLKFVHKICVGRDSSVGIATELRRLESPGIESRWWARFSAPV